MSGLVMASIAVVFLWKSELRLTVFRAINPAMKPALAKKLSVGMLGVGAAYLIIFLFEVIPYPHSKPYWIVVCSLVLSPLASLGFAAIFLTAIFKRKN